MGKIYYWQSNIKHWKYSWDSLSSGGGNAGGGGFGGGGSSGNGGGNGSDDLSKLKRKYSVIESVQEAAKRGEVTTKEFSDGRIRYYGQEVSSRTPGSTRGRAYVTELN